MRIYLPDVSPLWNLIFVPSLKRVKSGFSYFSHVQLQEIDGGKGDTLSPLGKTGNWFDLIFSPPRFHIFSSFPASFRFSRLFVQQTPAAPCLPASQSVSRQISRAGSPKLFYRTKILSQSTSPPPTRTIGLKMSFLVKKVGFLEGPKQAFSDSFWKFGNSRPPPSLIQEIVLKKQIDA